MSKIDQLYDPWDAGPLDSSKWSFSDFYATNTTFDSGAASSFTGNKLRLSATSTATFDSDGRILSVNEWDATSSSFVLPVEFDPTDRSKIEFAMILKKSGEPIDPSSYVAISLSEGIFYHLAFDNTGSLIQAPTSTYSATGDFWWRIREAGGTIFWETAPDASGVPGTWTQKATLATSSLGWSLSTVKVDLRRRNMGTALTSTSNGWVDLKQAGLAPAVIAPDPLFMLGNLF